MSFITFYLSCKINDIFNKQPSSLFEVFCWKCNGYLNQHVVEIASYLFYLSLIYLSNLLYHHVYVWLVFFQKIPSMIRVLLTPFSEIIQINKKRCFLHASDYRQYLHVVEKVSFQI